MEKARSIIIAILFITITFASCSFQIGEPPQEPITGLDDGSVKVIREDEGPEQGGILNLFMTTPRTLNPLTTSDLYIKQLSAFVFDSLFYEDPSGKINKALVKDYTFSQDGVILDIELKDNILFHDGTAFTSDDVAFSIETIKNAGEKSIYYPQARNIQSINILTRTKLRLVLNRADEAGIACLTFPILPEHIFKDWPVEGYTDSMKLIGTGPFIFESYDDNSINLARNDSWWLLNEEDGLKHPIWLDGISFKIYPNESDMMQAFQRQQIDIAWLEEGEIESYSKRADIFFNKYVSNILELLVLSPKGETNSALANDGFRNILIKYLGYYSSKNPFEKGMTTYDSGVSSDFMNKEEAISALEEIGYHYDMDREYLYTYRNNYKYPIKLSLTYNSLNIDREEISEWIYEALDSIGINVQIKASTYEELQKLSKNGRYDMMLLGCRIPLCSNQEETLDIINRDLNMNDEKDTIYPLYRKYGAVLYHNYIRGERKPLWNNIYNGWTEWYLVHTQE